MIKNNNIKMIYLLIDNCDSNRNVIKILLEKNNIYVEDVCNSDDAITLISSGKEYDAIWLDIKMPKMDGIELTRLLREKYRYKNPIIGISSIVDEITKYECIESGMDKFICKPLTKDIIVKTINI